MKDWPNLAAMFFDQAERRGDANFLWAKRDGGAFAPLTWRQAAAQAAGLAAALKARGVAPGDRVMLLSENRPEWLIADVAIMAAGGITVPAYVTNGPADHEYVLSHSGAKGVIVSTAALEAKLPASRGFTLSMERDWDGLASANVPRCTAARSETACLIYTSGTGGRPKGVMLSHGALLSNCVGAHGALESLGLGHEIFLSFLPLSHAYEHTAGQFFPVMIGAEIYYTDVESLAADLKTARPTIMTSVPRLYETMHGRITRGVKRQGGVKEKLFRNAVALGLKRYDGEPLSLGERAMDLICDLTVRKTVRAAFGGRMKAMVSGGAPLNPDIGRFFTALGLTILQGYGQTESAPIVSVNVRENNRVDTVGRPMKGVEVKIADDGEILVRGELVMQGYWKEPEATAAAIRDGWLHTGDVGEFDPQGRLRITDRKKDIIVNSGGDNIAPQKVEGMLTLEPEIAQAMVYGDKRPHLVALVVAAPDADRNAVAEAIERVNARLSQIERVRRFALAPEGFTIANGMMTPTLKVRRPQVIARYRNELEAMYGG
jgi:long-chain acyl-CoA synthetase